MRKENPLKHILSCLKGVEETSAGSYKALCPAHDDHDPSLSITEKEDGTVLVHCPVCKDQEKVLRALEERGISRSDLFARNGTGSDPNGGKKAKKRMCLTDVYDYKTPDGTFVKHNSLRFEPPPDGEQHHPNCLGEHCYSNRKDKDFRQARPDPDSGYVYGLDGVQTVLYNLEDVMQAALRGEMVVWVEGEKDADNGKERLGLTTTTCPMGAKHFKPHYPGFLMGADVVVVADNDGPGREHAEMVARELLPFAASVKILELPDLPENGDLTDWIDAGGTREVFERLSSLSQPYIPGGDGDDLFGAVRFTDLGEPEPRTFVVEELVPQGHSCLLHGAGGSSKSILAASLAISIASGNLPDFLDRTILRHGPALIIDFELDVDEQHRRVKALCGGLGIPVPDNLYYLSGLGLSTRDIFERAVKVCEKVGVVLAVIDSVGFAMSGDMESSRDVNAFFTDYVDPLRAIGVTPMIVDHQGKLQAGERYQRKTAFGSAFKEHRARSILQVEAVENNRDAGILKVRIRHKKANFSARLEPFDVEIMFSEGRIGVRTVELTAADNASEEARSATERVELALMDGDKTTAELAEYTGLSRQYLQNILPGLEREGIVRVVKTEGRTKTYGLPEPPGDDGPDSDGPDGNGPDNDGDKPPDEYSEVSNAGSSGGSPTADTAEKPSSPSPPFIACGNGDDGEVGGARISPDDPSTQHHLHLITSDEDLKALVRDLSGVDEVALDIETYPREKALDPRNGSIRMISVATGSLNKVVDVSKVHPDPLLDALKSKTLVLFNARFDLSFLRSTFGYEHEGEVRDVMLMHLVNYFAAGKRVEKKGRMCLEDPEETEGISDLGSVAKLYLGEILDKSEQDSDWSAPNLSREQIAYALKDTEILLRLDEALEARLCELGLLEVVDIENRALLGVTWAESNGMPFDEEAWLGLAEENATEARRLKAEINRYAPPHPEECKEWNWNSGPQTVETLELLGYDTSKLPRTDSGKPSVSESALKSIKSPTQAREFVQAMLRYRTVQKLASTYGEKWIKPARPTDHERVVDGRANTSYRQIVATGRTASRKPNLQNLPRDQRFRRAFRAPEGRRLVVADYAQIELLFGAIISGDESMLEALRNGENLHLKTARALTSDREILESEL